MTTQLSLPKTLPLPRYHVSAVRLALVREAPGAYRRRPLIRDPEAAAATIRDALSGLAQERFVSLHLDTRSRLLSVANISEGSLTACPVDPKVVFSTALLAGATRIILAHNHPSGDPAPSPEDLDLTERLCEAGELLGIRVDDHVIIGGQEHQSIRELNPRLFI